MDKLKMSPKERLFSRLAGKKVDKIPNLSIVMQIAAQFARIPYGEYTTSSVAMTEAQIRTAQAFGLDILTVMSDPYRETSAYGAEVIPQADNLPVCKTTVLSDLSKWRDQLHPFDPMTSVRTRCSVDAIAIYKRGYGDEYPIAGWVEGAFAEFCDLAGVSQGMVMIADDPETSYACMEFIANQAIRYANAQIDAGADIIGIGDAAASLISKRAYQKLVMPHEMRIIEAIHARGKKAKLHICGDINRILPLMVETGADIIDIDFMVDFGNAVELAKGKCAICGNINPVDVILRGTPEKVAEAVRACVKQCAENSLISSGCEVPKNTPYENFKSIDDTLLALVA